MVAEQAGALPTQAREGCCSLLDPGLACLSSPLGSKGDKLDKSGITAQFVHHVMPCIVALLAFVMLAVSTAHGCWRLLSRLRLCISTQQSTDGMNEITKWMVEEACSMRRGTLCCLRQAGGWQQR